MRLIDADAISRQAALDIIDAELSGWLTDDERLHLEGIGSGIAELPSAEPERKKGKWVDTGEGVLNAEIYECSECKGTVWIYCNSFKDWNFCPNCGADMRGGE